MFNDVATILFSEVGSAKTGLKWLMKTLIRLLVGLSNEQIRRKTNDLKNFEYRYFWLYNFKIPLDENHGWASCKYSR